MNMRELFTRLFLFQKRLFKSYGFIALFLCVIAITVGFKGLSSAEHGALKISVYIDDKADELALGIKDRMARGKSLLRYSFADSEEAAEGAVESGKADAAWIFPRNLAQILDDAAAEGFPGEAIRVVQREETVLLSASRNILVSFIYPEYARAVYEAYAHAELGLSDEDFALYDDFEHMNVNENLFEINFSVGGSRERMAEDINYIASPIRGILALWVLLCGFAGAVYIRRDESAGKLALYPLTKIQGIRAEFIGVVVFDATIIMGISLFLSGIPTDPAIDVLSLLLYGICAWLFTVFVSGFFARSESLVVFIPFLMVASMILCPVFIVSPAFLEPLSALNPAFFYLRCVNNPAFIFNQLVYIPAAMLLIVLWSKIIKGGKI